MAHLLGNRLVVAVQHFQDSVALSQRLQASAPVRNVDVIAPHGQGEVRVGRVCDGNVHLKRNVGRKTVCNWVALCTVKGDFD